MVLCIGLLYGVMCMPTAWFYVYAYCMVLCVGLLHGVMCRPTAWCYV